jgi:hypothetical protein
VPYKTARRWLATPDFAAAYRECRRRRVDEAVAGLQRVSSKAVKTLEKNLRCGSPAVENAAAVKILELSLKGVELGDLVAKVDELKALLETIRGERKTQRRG